MDRIKVILGSRESGNNSDDLAELTGLLDTLLEEKVITKQQYKYILKSYNNDL